MKRGGGSGCLKYCTSDVVADADASTRCLCLANDNEMGWNAPTCT